MSENNELIVPDKDLADWLYKLKKAAWTVLDIYDTGEGLKRITYERKEANR